MKKEINTQRQSSFTADGTPEINPKVSPPLDEASCSASSYNRTHRNAGKVVNAQIYIFEDGSYSAYGAVDQSIISSLEFFQKQSTNTSSDE